MSKKLLFFYFHMVYFWKLKFKKYVKLSFKRLTLNGSCDFPGMRIRSELHKPYSLP